MKLLVNKRSLIFPVVTPTVDLRQNIRKNCSFYGPEVLLGRVFAAVGSVFNTGQQSDWQCGWYGKQRFLHSDTK